VIAELAAYYLYEAFLGIFHYFADTFIWHCPSRLIVFYPATTKRQKQVMLKYDMQGTDIGITATDISQYKRPEMPWCE
jgi:hypothetical protein